jgi:hypothetical protein
MRHEMFVRCPSCGNDHYTDEKNLGVTDCHEGDMGQDVVTYTCPNTGVEVEATVYRRR